MNSRVIDTGFEYSNTTVIKPPFDQSLNKENNIKYTRVVIDSRDRTLAVFPNPSQYDITLEDDIDEVTAADIQVVDMPFSSYIININNNRLHVMVGGWLYDAIVETGNYTPVQLAVALNVALTSLGVGIFEVAYVPVKDAFQIYSSVSFMIFCKGSEYRNLTIGKVLGFGPKDYESATCTPYGSSLLTNVVECEFRCNLDEHKYIVLHVEQMSLNHSPNTVLHKSLALVSKQYSTLNYVTMNPIRKTFNPPIARLAKIRITLKDYYGNLYDFQNHDHRIEILFESRKHISKYTPY